MIFEAVTKESASKKEAVPSQANRGNSRALDQWRGFALLLVLISHGFYFTGQVYGIGRVGVNLFFFISGILVFRSLTGSSYKTDLERTFTFWKRRFLRLFPALAAYLIAMAPLVYFLQNLPDLPAGSDLYTYLQRVPFALIFAVNYHINPMSLGHLWSVSVEMQFYLLAPVIFLSGGRRDQQRFLIWTGILILLMALGVMPLFQNYQEKYEFHVAAWPMMLGFLLEYRKAWITRLPRTLMLACTGAGIALVLLSMLSMLCGMQMKGLVIGMGVAVFAPCFFCYVLGLSLPGVPGNILQWLGERTYSIYLWQQPLTLCGYLPNIVHPLGAALSIAVGAVWYHFFERPFLSAKRRS
ncbi:MAG TPA: acyltransferase [Candidatus Methylacidiphilales bacterium]